VGGLEGGPRSGSRTNPEWLEGSIMGREQKELEEANRENIIILLGQPYLDYRHHVYKKGLNKSRKGGV